MDATRRAVTTAGLLVIAIAQPSEATGFPRDEQASLVNIGTITQTGASIGFNSRYWPEFVIANGGLRAGVGSIDGVTGDWLKCIHANQAGTVSTIRYSYMKLVPGEIPEWRHMYEDRPTELWLEFEVYLAFNEAIGCHEWYELPVYDGATFGVTSFQMLNRASTGQTSIRVLDADGSVREVGFHDGTAPVRIEAGALHTIRLHYVPATVPYASGTVGSQDGVLQVWYANGSMLDVDLGRSGPLVFTKTVDTSHSGGLAKGHDFTSRPREGAHSGGGFSAYRLLSTFCDGRQPPDPDDPTADTYTSSRSWYTHYGLIPGHCVDDGADPPPLSARFTGWHDYRLYQGRGALTGKVEAHLDPALTILASSSGPLEPIEPTPGDVYLRTFQLDDLEPDTVYWFTFVRELSVDDRVITLRSEPCVLRTPSVPGGPIAGPISIIHSSCQVEWRLPSPVYQYRGLDAVNDNAYADRCRLHFMLGDNTYLDEAQYQPDGARGAEWPEEFAGEYGMQMLCGTMLRFYTRHWNVHLGDDHEIACNYRGIELEVDDTTTNWDTNGDGDVVPGDHYTKTPYAVLQLATAAERTWFYDRLPDPTNPKRYRITADRPLDHQGNPYRDDDAYSHYFDTADCRFLFIDTRRFRDYGEGGGAKTMLGPQKAFIHDAIDGCTASNLLLMLQGEFTDQGPDGDLKPSDSYGVPNYPMLKAERDELIAHVEANPIIRAVAVLTGDHHFVYVTRQQFADCRWLGEILNGATTSNVQDPSRLDWAPDDPLFLSDFGLYDFWLTEYGIRGARIRAGVILELDEQANTLRCQIERYEREACTEFDEVLAPALAPRCPADIDRSGAVGFPDLTQLLSDWGPCDGVCAADLDCDRTVAFPDLTALLAMWGPCPR